MRAREGWSGKEKPRKSFGHILFSTPMICGGGGVGHAGESKNVFQKKL